MLFIATDEATLVTYEANARARGFESELARDGYEALLLAYLARPDVLVLDARDPCIAARTVLQRFREGIYTRAIPAILVGPGTDLDSAGGGYLHNIQSSDPLDVFRALERVLDEADVEGLAAESPSEARAASQRV